MEDRLQVLKSLLLTGEAHTQESIQKYLKQKKYKVNQSTISRDLKRLGAIRTIDPDGSLVYRLADSLSSAPIPHGLLGSLSSLVLEIHHNDYMIVLKTSPGSAALIARHIDSSRIEGVLGTIAGDDTVFIALHSGFKASSIAKQFATEFGITSPG